MDIENSPPVRFRAVLEFTFPDADPNDPSDYDKLLEQMKVTLENASNVNCKHILIREANIIAAGDNYEDWRGGWKYDFSSFSPGMSHIFGVTYPIVAVDPEDLARVWEVMSKAEAGQLKHVNVALAIGQVLRPESDAQATIFRASILRALQARNTVPAAASKAVFKRAASFPCERPLENLESVANFFRD
jgi:hypothetical protein